MIGIVSPLAFALRTTPYVLCPAIESGVNPLIAPEFGNGQSLHQFCCWADKYSNTLVTYKLEQIVWIPLSMTGELVTVYCKDKNCLAFNTGIAKRSKKKRRGGKGNWISVFIDTWEHSFLCVRFASVICGQISLEKRSCVETLEQLPVPKGSYKDAGKGLSSGTVAIGKGCRV